MKVKITAIVELDPRWTKGMMLNTDNPISLLREKLESSHGLQGSIGFRGKVTKLNIKELKERS